MEPVITYLLGAGASANCLPVIDELPGRLNALMGQIIGRCNTAAGTDYKFQNEELVNAARKLGDDMKVLLNDLDAHNTIDTLAKKYYLTKKHEELKKLKKILITYFFYEQIFKSGDIRPNVLKELPDKRYDSFIATIIDKKIESLKLPSNFKMITWNYDIQFELAYREYLLSASVEEMQRRIQAIPSEEYLNIKQTFDLNEFCLIRLNGTAGYKSYLSPVMKINPPYDPIPNYELYTKVVKSYSNISDNDMKMFNYSWEDPKEFEFAHEKLNLIKEEAKRIMNQTEYLVIIGYSFPLFNRSVDKELIAALGPRLKNIYVQDLKERSSEIRKLLLDSFDRFKNAHPNLIQNIEYVNQFFIPPSANI